MTTTGQNTMKDSKFRIDVQPNEYKTVWSFKVHDAWTGRLLGEGTGFTTGLMARAAAQIFCSWYVA
jgi:hypothetical protein